MNLETARQQLTQLPGEILWPDDTTVTPAAVQTLLEAGELREAMPGVYVKTHHNPHLIVRAIHIGPERIAVEHWRRKGERVMPHGADAVRYMRLSTQVALRSIYYFSGHTHDMTVFNQRITFTHAPTWVTAHADTPLAVPVAALHYAGLEHADHILKQLLPEHQEPFKQVLDERRQHGAGEE